MRRIFVISCFVVIAVAATYAATIQSSNPAQVTRQPEINGVTPTTTPPPTPTALPTPTAPPT